VAQLVDAVHKLTTGIISLADHIREFSEELRRMQLNMRSLKVKLEILAVAFADPSNESWLSHDLFTDFQMSLLEVHCDIEAVAKILKTYDLKQQEKHSLRKGLRYQMRDQKALAGCRQNLEFSEKNLQRMETRIHTYVKADPTNIFN
jgi:hypothetical protein